jgi:DNA-binding beta-propeller fold protein YncE
VRGSDLQDPGDSLSVLRASTGEVLGSVKVTEAAGTAPVEVVFVPGSDPPVAYVTNMYGHTLSTVTWNPGTESFDAAAAFDFEPVGAAVPLEIYFDDAGETMYVTTAKPGHLHIFDISEDVTKPELKQSIATAEGAHHVGFNKDMTMAWVQNSLLNLPGMSDGSITVVDLSTGEVVASVDTLKNDGFNPNSLVLLPEWNHPAGH